MGINFMRIFKGGHTVPKSIQFFFLIRPYNDGWQCPIQSFSGQLLYNKVNPNFHSIYLCKNSSYSSSITQSLRVQYQQKLIFSPGLRVSPLQLVL